jgi:hypothetical protein
VCINWRWPWRFGCLSPSRFFGVSFLKVSSLQVSPEGRDSTDGGQRVPRQVTEQLQDFGDAQRRPRGPC